MTITTKVCDRCKRPLKYHGWTGIFKNLRRSRFLDVIEIHNGNPDGYSYCNMGMEICADCTKSFKEWFKNPEREDNEDASD